MLGSDYRKAQSEDQESLRICDGVYVSPLESTILHDHCPQHVRTSFCIDGQPVFDVPLESGKCSNLRLRDQSASETKDLSTSDGHDSPER